MFFLAKSSFVIFILTVCAVNATWCKLLNIILFFFMYHNSVNCFLGQNIRTILSGELRQNENYGGMKNQVMILNEKHILFVLIIL